MSDYYFGKIRQRWTATNTGTNAGVSATQAAPSTGQKLVCAGIQASGDAAAIVTIESPASTVLWRKRFAAAFTLSESFAPGTIVGATAQAMIVKVSASTAASEGNIQGFTVAG